VQKEREFWKEVSLETVSLLKMPLTIEGKFGMLIIPKVQIVFAGGRKMVIKETVVNNQVGLHARPATFFIQKANEYKSSIWVEKDERRVNAKSLLGVLSLGIVKGTSISLIADGPDENEALEGLAELISTNFCE
jgi:phosphocarrier protein